MERPNLTNEQRQHWEQQLIQAELAYEKALDMLGYEHYIDKYDIAEDMGRVALRSSLTQSKH